MQNFVISSLLNIFFSPISGAPPHVFKVSQKKQTYHFLIFQTFIFVPTNWKMNQQKRQNEATPHSRRPLGSRRRCRSHPAIAIAWPLGSAAALRFPYDVLPTVGFIKGWFGWGIPRKMPQPCRFWNYSNVFNICPGYSLWMPDKVEIDRSNHIETTEFWGKPGG